MNKLSLATAILVSTFAINAQAYQTEVSGMYEYTEYDDNNEVNTVSLNGKYYLNPVQSKAGAPLAEAAFLNKASNIGLGYVYAKESYDMPAYYLDPSIFYDETATLTAKYNILGVNAEFFIPNSQFYVSGNINRTNVKNTLSIDGFGSHSESENGTGYAIEAGFLPVNGLLLAVGVTDQSESVDPILATKYGFVTTTANAAAISGEDEDTAVTLRAKYVTQLGGFYTNFEAKTYIGDETTYRLGADLYLDPTLSLGVSFTDSTMDDSDTIFNIRAQKFITPELALGLGYTTIDGADSYGVNGIFRF